MPILANFAMLLRKDGKKVAKMKVDFIKTHIKYLKT